MQIHQSRIPLPSASQDALDEPDIKVPIRVKITLPYLVLAFAILTGAAYILMRVIFDTVEERFNNQLIEASKLTSEWIVREETRLLKSLRLFIYLEGIPEAVKSGDSADLRSKAFALLVSQQEEEVLFFDKSGQLLLSAHHLPGSPVEEFNFSVGGGELFASYPLIQQVLRCEIDTRGDKYAGLVQQPDKSTLFVAGPMIDADGSCVGAVLVGKSLATIASQIRTEILAQVTIYDLSGNPLQSTLPEPVPVEAALISTLKSSQPFVTKRTLGEIRPISLFDITYTELLRPFQLRTDANLGFIGISLARNFWVTTTSLTRLQVAVVVALFIILVVIVGITIANWITRPILGLVDASAKVSQGDLGVRLTPTGNDEIAYLMQNFNQMVSSIKRSHHDLVKAYDDTIAGWGVMLDQRDQVTKGHTSRVEEITVHLARELGISEDQIVHVRRGAIIHDIGKMAVPDSILKKPGVLTEGEWKIMRMHPQYAYDVLYPIEFLRPALNIPYCHHERWDGSGYPRGLKGEEIPIEARIFAVVDVWDAMTNDRPYRDALDPQDVLTYIKVMSGRLFDPRVVDAFLKFINLETIEATERWNSLSL